MTKKHTQASLGIFWKGEEVDGITVYAYWPRKLEKEPLLELVVEPESTQRKPTRLDSENWTVWLWDIRVTRWPRADCWISMVVKMLQGLVDQGATVAWCGLEGMFVDPPGLFDPQVMLGGVWAAVDNQGNVYGPPELSEKFTTLGKEELEKLQRLL